MLWWWRRRVDEGIRGSCFSKKGSASERNQKMPNVVHTFWPGNYPWFSTGHYSTIEGIWWCACVHTYPIHMRRTEVRPGMGSTVQQVASSLHPAVTLQLLSFFVHAQPVLVSQLVLCAQYNIHSSKDKIYPGNLTNQGGWGSSARKGRIHRPGNSLS